MVDHCHGSERETSPEKTSPAPSCCGGGEKSKARPDLLLWGSLLACAVLYAIYFSGLAVPAWLMHLAHGVYELLNTMWWGVALGVVFVGLLHFVPQNLVASILGRGGSVNGIVRATAAGVLLDLCSHGILMVGMKLYQKGASLGQVMAFLIASPWNSFSLTLVMIALIGLPWTLAFIALSMVVAVIAGLIFDSLVARKRLQENIYTEQATEAAPVLPQLKALIAGVRITPSNLLELFRQGLKGSRMVVRWLMFGVLLASMIRAFVPTDLFADWFGPTLVGLLLTAVAATIIEVCSEGSAPIAADLMNRARAPGNSFLFLMAGVATDYTEIMVIRDTMKSWKTALFLPLVVLPQVLLVAILLNTFS